MEATAYSSSGEAVESCSTSYLQDVLSLEILLHILLFLRPIDKFRLRLTCRRFYMAVSDPAAWRLMVFDCYDTPYRKALDATLRFCSPGVKELEVNTRKLIPRFPWVRFTKHISKCAPTLTHISLLGFHPSYEQVNTSLAPFPSLSHLTLEFESSHTVWIPAIRSLKSFEIHTSKICEYFLSTVLGTWSKNGFFPRQFQIGGERCVILRRLLGRVEGFVHRHFSPSLSSDEQAQFYCMYCDGPPGIFQHCPFLQLKIEGSYCSVPVAHCSEITAAPLLLVLSSPPSATRIATTTQLPKVCVEVPFSSVASTLAHLSLKYDHGLNHDNLKEVAFHCPLLKTLCLDGCENALVDLSGLASISVQCLRLEGLNLIGIHVEGIDRTLLWTVLSNFRKLLYLSVEFCVLPVACQLPEKKIDTLLSMQVGSGNTSECIGCRSVSNTNLETMARIIPTNLKVLIMSFPYGASASIGSGFNDLLCAVPKLQELHIGKRMNLILPTNPVCYQNIEKLYVNCFSSNITCEFVEALIHSGQLTHCSFNIDVFSLDAMHKLIRAPKLVCCHVCYCRYRVNYRRRSQQESNIRKAARVRGIPDFSYEARKWHLIPDPVTAGLMWSNY